MPIDARVPNALLRMQAGYQNKGLSSIHKSAPEYYIAADRTLLLMPLLLQVAPADGTRYHTHLAREFTTIPMLDSSLECTCDKMPRTP